MGHHDFSAIFIKPSLLNLLALSFHVLSARLFLPYILPLLSSPFLFSPSFFMSYLSSPKYSINFFIKEFIYYQKNINYAQYFTRGNLIPEIGNKGDRKAEKSTRRQKSTEATRRSAYNRKLLPLPGWRNKRVFLEWYRWS